MRDALLARFLTHRLDEDEQLVGRDRPLAPDLGQWQATPPTTLPARLLGEVRAGRTLLVDWARSTPGTDRRAVLRRRVELAASRYDRSPAWDPAWGRAAPGPDEPGTDSSDGTGGSDGTGAGEP